MNHEYTRALFIAVKLKNTQGEITCHIISFLHPPNRRAMR
ncbi:hypothetical protein KsCSTR_18440 [Candidatus Kuenenia stuttgartiensis]|uniref:Uncharacterized protein n=1 Tax=Kuenenia stuttgartiensis TaxID=174633 RepID=A0A6G7GPH2_KUEST|nr:hypothetical protein KsCSTR_18440 [Candidatus Kuenenia stuttgartiensis]